MTANIDWVDIVIRLALAGLLGGVLGAEREWDGQDAGFRTHLLVSLGSALFSVMSVAGFDSFITSGATNVTVDVSRIASYVAPGIGFIGGGAILKYGGHARGVTTAASLWSCAAVGMAAGLGAWQAAVAACVITLFALEALQPLGNLIKRASRRRTAAISVEVDKGCDLGAIVGLLAASEVEIKELTFGWDPQLVGHLTVRLWNPLRPWQVPRLIDSLRGISGVHHVDMPGETIQDR